MVVKRGNSTRKNNH
jgi:hypothetical protein